MGTEYSSQKCPNCGSTKFEYIKETKKWECFYCGTLIERREEPDSLFSIKNVVRQVLIDVTYQRFNEAKCNLTECEKIDARYVGTVIAKICYYLNAALYDRITEQEKKNMISQLKRYYAVLCEYGDGPNEQEIALYEFLDSAEAYGTLILAFDTLASQKRIDILYDFFKPEEVYSLMLNSNLLNFMLKHGKYDFADRIVKNCDNIDKKSALQLLLGSYPDGANKVENCNLLISQNLLSFDERGIVENYLYTSPDSVTTKYGIACEALKTAAYPSVKCVMETVIGSLTQAEEVKKIFEAMLSKKLSDSEIATVIEYDFAKCSQEIILYIVTLFKDTKQYAVFTLQNFSALFNNKAVSYEYKKKIMDVMLCFDINERTKEQAVACYLNEVRADSFEQRRDFLKYLFALIPSLSTVSAEKYIISCTLDGENKPEVVGMIFGMNNINKAFFRDTFDKYLLSSNDGPAVTDMMIDALSQQGLKLSENAFFNMLVNPSLCEQTKLNLLRRFKNSPTQYLGIMDRYIAAVNSQTFSGAIFQELLDYVSSVTFESVAKYLLQIRDIQTSKAISSQRLAGKCRVPVLPQICTVQHAGYSVECSVAQAYILISPDDPSVTCAVLNALNASGEKLNGEVVVAGSGRKFKKYLAGVRNSLSQTTLAAASAYGLL